MAEQPKFLAAVLGLTLLALTLLQKVRPTSADNVFETGGFSTREFKIGERSSCSPPKSLLILSPEESGIYPVLMFNHGTSLQNSWYSDVLAHISSHGYIVVAPQYYNMMPPAAQAEIDWAAEVANWLPSGLQCALPENIQADLNSLALAGHSRGGYIAFALALGHASIPLKVNFMVLAGVDPVAGLSRWMELEPIILKDVPCSFNLSIPTAIIGSGLGSTPALPFMPACAPEGVSHAEFFLDCNPPSAHFVTSQYGHMDILNDPIGEMMLIMCTGAGWLTSRDPLRKTIGGIVVALLEGALKGDYTDYNNILKEPSLAPATLNPVQNKTSCASCSIKAQHNDHGSFLGLMDEL